jgi:hypothetical protein
MMDPKKGIDAIVASVHYRLEGHDYPVVDVFVPMDEIGSEARFSDNAAAERLGLSEMKFITREGIITPKRGLDFVRNLWRAFVGNTGIYADYARDGKVFPRHHDKPEGQE